MLLSIESRKKDWVSKDFKDFVLKKAQVTRNKIYQDGINLNKEANKRLGKAIETNNVINVIKTFSDDYAKANFKTHDMTELVIKWNINPHLYVNDIGNVAKSANNFMNKWMLNLGKWQGKTKALNHYTV